MLAEKEQMLIKLEESFKNKLKSHALQLENKF